MIIYDAHCDTITRLMDNNQNLYQNDGHVDIQRIHGQKGHVQVFAAWIDPAYKMHPLKRCLQIMDVFFDQMAKYKPYIVFAADYEQVMQAVDKGKVAALLSIEGGEAIQGDLGVLRMLYRLGVRSIGLTWNGKNEIGTGVGAGDEGLTPFGLEVIQEMNTLGMLIDVSHLSPKGFWDVIGHSSQPVIASHSNAKAICNHKRNLTDAQFQAMAEKGGVVGINLYADFIKTGGKADINDVIRHIEHFMGLGGENHVGLGADFDGMDRTPEGINGVQDLNKIFDGLLKLNYTQEQVEKIAGKNFLELLKKVLKKQAYQ